MNKKFIKFVAVIAIMLFVSCDVDKEGGLSWKDIDSIVTSSMGHSMVEDKIWGKTFCGYSSGMKFDSYFEFQFHPRPAGNGVSSNDYKVTITSRGEVPWTIHWRPGKMEPNNESFGENYIQVWIYMNDEEYDPNHIFSHYLMKSKITYDAKNLVVYGIDYFDNKYTLNLHLKE